MFFGWQGIALFIGMAVFVVLTIVFFAKRVQ